MLPRGGNGCTIPKIAYSAGNHRVTLLRILHLKDVSKEAAFGSAAYQHECSAFTDLVSPSVLSGVLSGVAVTIPIIARRNGTIDYVVFSALLGITLLRVVLTYDIACQWSKKYRARMQELPQPMHIPETTTVEVAMPGWQIWMTIGG